MTAVRQVTVLVCSLAVPALLAQTTSTTRKTTPPATVITAPTEAASTTATTTPSTPPVTADTDKDLNDPRAMKLSLDDAIKTAMERNVGIQVSRYEYRASGESLRSQYGIYDWIGTADMERQNLKSPTISQFQSSGQTNAIANFGIQQA